MNQAKAKMDSLQNYVNSSGRISKSYLFNTYMTFLDKGILVYHNVGGNNPHTKWGKTLRTFLIGDSYHY